MKALEELTQDIREKLPRLKELSEGCNFLMKNGSEFQYEYKVLQVYGGGQIADTGGYDDVYCDVYSDWDGVEERCYLDVIERRAEIIGKEPMLNDVLEWLQVKSQSDFEPADKRYLTHFLAFKLSEWELSKPFLKHQSPELIEFLHGLINH